MNDVDKKTLLLVEDEVLIAMGRQQELEKHGYNVLTVNTGEKAIAVSKENIDIDLILMDIDLGCGIDGSEAAKRILSNMDIPILFLSNHIKTEIVAVITSYGYVAKSVDTAELNILIKMALRFGLN